MPVFRIAVLVLLLATASDVFTQSQEASSRNGPTFDVVSIRRNTQGLLAISRIVERPDGGFDRPNTPVSTLITRAYPPSIPKDMIGLPDWANTERYDVRTTSSLSHATTDDRVAMLRAMLADRFKLLVHVEKRDRPAYDLVVARRDGRLGPGLKLSGVDCDASVATRDVGDVNQSSEVPLIQPQPQRPDFSEPPPRCTLRVVAAALRGRNGHPPSDVGDLLEGDGTMDNLAMSLRTPAGRFVLNKTNRSGTYRVRMNFDLLATLRGPDATTSPSGATPSVFTAIQEQLGLKLEPSHAQQETLIIDRLERPTED